MMVDHYPMATTAAAAQMEAVTTMVAVQMEAMAMMAADQMAGPTATSMSEMVLLAGWNDRLQSDDTRRW